MSVARSTRPAALGSSTALAACSDVTVAYGEGPARIVALSSASLSLGAGELVSLVGTSGSGKTTLLHVLGGLVEPTEGSVTWKGDALSSVDASARRRARSGGIAYVFQGANLLPHLSAWENIAFASLISSRVDPGRDVVTPDHALALVGLEAKAAALPAELSGGELQRVAIARAVAQQPELLLCDEPTGHLDSETGARILDMLVALRGAAGLTLLIATHDEGVAARAERSVELVEGRINGSPA